MEAAKAGRRVGGRLGRDADAQGGRDGAGLQVQTRIGPGPCARPEPDRARAISRRPLRGRRGAERRHI